VRHRTEILLSYPDNGWAPNEAPARVERAAATGDGRRSFQLRTKGSIMNSLAWIGIIVWGLVVTGFGLVSATPPLEQAGELAAHDVFFLVSGGLLTCLIGIVGLLGFMGWIPGLNSGAGSQELAK
jgi:hypothetical protein